MCPAWSTTRCPLDDLLRRARELEHSDDRGQRGVLFYEQYKDDAAFDAHRKAPHLAAYRERREKEGLTEGAVEVEIYRSLTD